MQGKEHSKKRCNMIDMIRGSVLISMCFYHMMWDLVYIKGLNIEWFRSDAAYIWQQSICWMFILLSGFCWSLGRMKLKRGILVFCAGILVTAISMFLAPGQRIIFGILTLLGSCMILCIPAEKFLKKISSEAGGVLCMLLFLFTKSVNNKTLGIGDFKLIALPEAWYDKGYFMTFLGFTDNNFSSADYFPILPWIFLFLTGYFGYRLASERGVMEFLSKINWNNRAVTFLGRHSLWVYLVHQPVIYLGIQIVSLSLP